MKKRILSVVLAAAMLIGTAAAALMQAPAVPAQAAAGGAYISERFRDPGATKPVAPAGNYTLAGIFAIISFILFIATLILLYQDWVELSAA